MKLRELKYTEDSRKNRKRKGRGTGSGNGKTAGLGQNGQKSRSGGGVRLGFEGGQNPLYRRVPKRGFSNYPFKKEFAVINVSDLNKFEAGAAITPELLIETGMVKQVKDGIKVLGNGTIDVKLKVSAHQFSKSAIEKIKAANGEIEEI